MIDQVDKALADMKVIEETIDQLRQENANLRYDKVQLRRSLTDAQTELAAAHNRILQLENDPHD